MVGEESSTSMSGHIHVRLSCSSFLSFLTTSMFNFILFTKLIGTVPRFTIRHIYSLKLLKNSQSALHDSIVLGSSINNLLPTFYLLQNWVNTESNLFANMNLFSSWNYSRLTIVLITKTSAHIGRCSQAQRTSLLVSIHLSICTSWKCELSSLPSVLSLIHVLKDYIMSL